MATCVSCKNEFKKGEGSYLAPSGGFSHSKSTEGYCKHCMDMHSDDQNYERFGVPKRVSFIALHNGLMRHFGKVPEPNDEPDFRQEAVPKGKDKKPEVPELYNNSKHCAFCSGEFKKGEKTKKAMGEYSVHDKCPPYPSFKSYMSKKHA